jgi:predicted deacetylase
MNERAVSLVLHDVAPETWPAYRRFVHAVEALGTVPLTLLVVPDFHHRGALDRFPAFRAALERRIGRGDELVLHGLFHSDEAPLRLDPADYCRRRIYTREGEFYPLDERQALARLEVGLELFHRYRWPVAGFVAPAWLMGHGTRSALTRLPLRYTSDPGGLIRLPDWRRVEAPSLVWSARSAWRRRASLLWNRNRLRRGRAQPLLRLGLHPVDMVHEGAVRFWLETLAVLLAERTPVTKWQWLQRCG